MHNTKKHAAPCDYTKPILQNIGYMLCLCMFWSQIGSMQELKTEILRQFVCLSFRIYVVVPNSCNHAMHSIEYNIAYIHITTYDVIIVVIDIILTILKYLYNHSYCYCSSS